MLLAVWIAQPQDHLPRDGAIHKGLGYSALINNEDSPPQTFPQANRSRKFLSWGFSVRWLQAVTSLHLKLTGMCGTFFSPKFSLFNYFWNESTCIGLSSLRRCLSENPLFVNSEMTGTPNVLIELTDKLDQLFAKKVCSTQQNKGRILRKYSGFFERVAQCLSNTWSFHSWTSVND